MAVVGSPRAWPEGLCLERTEVLLGGLCAAEPCLGEPRPPLGRTDRDRAVLGRLRRGLAGRRAHLGADPREDCADRLLGGEALLDQGAQNALQAVGGGVG